MIGKRIQNYIIENGISQHYICETANLTPSELTNVYKDDENIDCLVYYRICKALNVSLDYFMKE